MLLYLIPLAAILCIIAGIITIIIKKTRKIGRILLSSGVVLGFIPTTLVCMLIVAFQDINKAEEYGTLLAIAMMLIMLAIVFVIFGIIKKKAVWIPLTAAFTLLTLLTVSNYAYGRYLDSIPEMNERADLLAQYKPFTEPDESKIARLEKDAALNLESEIPIMDGATALYPIYSAFANEVYPSTASDKVLCTGTTVAYEKIVNGSADVIFAAAPSKKQLEYAKENGVELELTPIGYEAFVFFVNSKNPIDEVSLEDIKEIYSGKITKWNELGVSGFGKIRAFQREEGSGSQSALLRLMEGKELMTPPKEDVVYGMGGIIEQTANYKNFKNALGFSFRFYSTEMVKNSQIKLLKINGVEPTRENIENGTYPITSNFYAVTRKGDTSENTKKLIDWILTDEGKEIIDKTGYTPIK